MTRLGFYFDMTACIGCRTCQIACKDKNDLDVDILYRRVRTFETGAFPNVGVYHYSHSCNHCEDAKCVKGCPTGAMHFNEDGTVQHDKDLCIGCKYCVMNCPYNVPQYIEEENVVGKCDSCIDLRKEGKNPACVDACVMRCLQFGDLDELTKGFEANVTNELPFLPSASITNPSVLINPKQCAKTDEYKRKEY